MSVPSKCNKSAAPVMGKNTMMFKAIKGHLERNSALEKLLPHIRGNVVAKNYWGTKSVHRLVQSSASAQKNLFLPSSLHPDQDFQIINDVHILKPGDKVGASEAALLNMLIISPFSYGLMVEQAYDSGTIFAPEILDIKDVRKKFLAGVCLSIDYSTTASAPHSIVNGFKNFLAIAAVTEVEFKKAATIKEDIKDPSRVTAAAVPEKKEEKNEEFESEDDDMGSGLFDFELFH